MEKFPKILLAMVVTAIGISLWSWRPSKTTAIDGSLAAPISEQVDGSLPVLNDDSKHTKSSSDTQNSRKLLGEKAFVFTKSHLPQKGNGQDVIDRLAAAANAGDSDAAFEIYLKVSACRRALITTTNDAELAAYKRAGIAESVLATEERILSECAGLDFEDGLASENWLEKAAFGGSTEAKILYAIDSSASLGASAEMLKDPEKVARYRRNAVVFLNEAANSGSVDALMSLANAYDAGVLVKKNPATSYAYYLAVQRVNSGLIPQVLLDGVLRQMTQQDINSAKERSQQIYDRCCVK